MPVTVIDFTAFIGCLATSSGEIDPSVGVIPLAATNRPEHVRKIRVAADVDLDKSRVSPPVSPARTSSS
jgi:hypothetical protein